MIQAWKSYKAWWDIYGSSCGADEKTFEEHINEMTLYELMEKLEFWEAN